MRYIILIIMVHGLITSHAQKKHSLGIGYFRGEQDNHNHLWISPKVFMQLPANKPSNPNFTLQVGYSRSLSKQL